MKKIILLCLLLFVYNAQSQNFKITKVIADKETKKPLEYVTVSNDLDNALSNSEGIFSFISTKNEIISAP